MKMITTALRYITAVAMAFLALMPMAPSIEAQPLTQQEHASLMNIAGEERLSTLRSVTARRYGKTEELPMLNQLYEEATRAGNANYTIKAIDMLVQYYYNAGSGADIARYIDASNKIKYDDTEIDEYYFSALLTKCRFLAESGDIKTAVDVATDISRIAKEMESKEGELVCYEALGVIYSASRSYEMAVEAYSTALEKREKEGMLSPKTEGRIVAYMLQACVYCSNWVVLDNNVGRLQSIVKKEWDKFTGEVCSEVYELLFYSFNILRQCSNGKPGSADKFVVQLDKCNDRNDRVSLLTYYEATARFYEVSNQVSKALAMMRKASELDLSNAPILQQHLATILMLSGQKDLADSLMADAGKRIVAEEYAPYVEKLSKLQREYKLDSMEFAHSEDVTKALRKRYYVEIIILILLTIAIVTIKVLSSQSKSMRRKLEATEKQLKEEKEELIKKEKKLSTAIEKANENIQLKTGFLSNMTHEIRTPLNSILGFSELISSLAVSDDHKEYAQYIRSNSNDLLVLVNNILDLARIDSGRMKLTMETCNIKEIINEAIFKLGNNPNVQVKVNCPDSLIVITDHARLLQIVVNMLSNSYKFTDSGEVRFTVSETADKNLKIRCEDDGVGIPYESSELVFERFEKLGSFKQGTGLGLSICRGIATLLGGRIYVDADYRSGAAFELVIPADCSHSETPSGLIHNISESL